MLMKAIDFDDQMSLKSRLDFFDLLSSSLSLSY